MRYRIHFIDVQNALQNYIWILEDTETQEAVAVDPTEADLVTQLSKLSTHFKTNLAHSLA